MTETPLPPASEQQAAPATPETHPRLLYTLLALLTAALAFGGWGVMEDLRVRIRRAGVAAARAAGQDRAARTTRRHADPLRPDQPRGQPRPAEHPGRARRGDRRPARRCRLLRAPGRRHRPAPRPERARSCSCSRRTTGLALHRHADPEPQPRRGQHAARLTLSRRRHPRRQAAAAGLGATCASSRMRRRCSTRSSISSRSRATWCCRPDSSRCGCSARLEPTGGAAIEQSFTWADAMRATPPARRVEAALAEPPDPESTSMSPISKP